MLRILIADDHELIRTGLKRILHDEFTFAEFDEAENGKDLLQKALSANWNIILCDLNLPDMSGIKALKEIKAKRPEIAVLIISIQTEEQYCKTVLRAGASGYLTKDAASGELINAVHTILDGKKYTTSVSSERKPPFYKSLHEQFSLRELEVLQQLASGKSLIEIGENLSLSPSTISTFRARILRKLNLLNNAELIRYAIENNLI